MSILPWPSRRVMGFTVKRRRPIWYAAFARAAPWLNVSLTAGSIKLFWLIVAGLLDREVDAPSYQAGGEAIAVKRADGIRNAGEHFVDLRLLFGRDIGANGGHDFEALVVHARRGAETTGA